MANFDFDALEKRMQDLGKPLSADEMDSYINQLGSINGAQAEKAKDYIARLKIMKERAAVFDRDTAEFEKKLESMTSEEFAAIDKEIDEHITPEKVAEAAGKTEGLSDEENDAILDFITLEAKLIALQEGELNLSDRGYDNIIKQAVQRTEAGMAQSVVASYYDKEITLLMEQLEKETDKTKKDEIRSKIEKMQEAQTHVPEFTGFSDLKDKNIPVNKDIIAGYIAAKSAVNSAKHAIIEKFFGKNTKIGAFARRADEKLSKTFGKIYTVPRDIIKKAGPKAIVNAAGGIVCSAIAGPAGPAIWAGVKTVYLGLEAAVEQRKEKNKAREDLQNIEAQIAQNSNNPEVLKELAKQKEACQKKISASYFGFLKSHPDKLIHLGISAFSAAGSSYLVYSGMNSIDLSDSLGGVRDTVANSDIVGRFGNLSEKISNTGLKFSGRTVLGASTSVLNGVSTAGLELGRAFSDKEHRKEHLKKAFKSFTIGFVGAAAAMGLNSWMMNRAEAKSGLQNIPSKESDANISELQAQESDLGKTLQPEIYQMNTSTHDTIKDLMIRGPKYAAKYLHDQGLLNEKDAAFFQRNGYMTSRRLKEILDSGVLKEEHASSLLAEHDRVLTPTGYRLAEDQARWDEYIAAKRAVKDAISEKGNEALSGADASVLNPVVSRDDLNVLMNDPNVSFSDLSKMNNLGDKQAFLSEAGKEELRNAVENARKDSAQVEAETIPYPEDMKPYNTPDGNPPVYEEPVVKIEKHEMPDGGTYAIQERDGVLRTAIGVNVENKDIAAFNEQTGLSLEPNMNTRKIIAQEKIYEDLLRRQSGGETLSAAEQQFMKTFDQKLENDYGVVRDENGVIVSCDDLENSSLKTESSQVQPENMGGHNDISGNEPYVILENGSVVYNQSLTTEDMAQVNRFVPQTTKNAKGLYVCGNSVAGIEHVAVEQERAILSGIYANDKAYQYMQAKQASGETLSEVETKFMRGHESILEQRGLTHDDSGALTVVDEKARDFDSLGIVNSRSKIDQMRMDAGSSYNPSLKYGLYKGENLEKKVNFDSYKVAKKFNFTEEERQQWAGAVVKAKESGCEVIVSQDKNGKNMLFMRDKKDPNIYTNFSDKNSSGVEKQAIEIGKRMTKNYGQRE